MAVTCAYGYVPPLGWDFLTGTGREDRVWRRMGGGFFGVYFTVGSAAGNGHFWAIFRPFLGRLLPFAGGANS